MKNYKTVKPPQRYMTLKMIYETFGPRSVVAYRCKYDEDGIPEGGYVVAVQDEPGAKTDGLKAYMKQFKQKHKNREPIFFLRIEEPKPGVLGLIRDDGSGEVRSLPKIREEKSEAETAVANIPDEILANALASVLRKEKP